MGADEVRVPWEDPADLLDRKKYAEYLTRWLVAKGGPFVLSLNAEWGTGKTFFLRHWQAMIRDDHPVVYINAWESDFSDDPMIAVMASMYEQLKDYLPDDLKVVQSFSEKMKAGGRFIKHLTPLMAKGVVSRALGGEAADELAGAWSGSEDDLAKAAEKSMGLLLEEHQKTVGSVEGFEVALRELVDDVTRRDREKPLFVFVDELDRCRPTYAIEMLEMVKHLFSVDGVVYVIATDSGQLQHSIRALYGTGFDGEGYLRRFFDQEYMLPTPSYAEYSEYLSTSFPDEISLRYSCFQPWAVEGYPVSRPAEWGEKDNFSFFLSMFSAHFGLSLRSMNQIGARISAVLENIECDLDGAFLIGLMVLNSKKRDFYSELREALKKGVPLSPEQFNKEVGVGGERVRWYSRGRGMGEGYEKYYTVNDILLLYCEGIVDSNKVDWDDIYERSRSGVSLSDFVMRAERESKEGSNRNAIGYSSYFDLVDMAGAVS